ncbi:FRG domain-containing protein [Paenibacillus polymyxa]|uniref:FRG domain-containing protein n=1 Tax=Paenibacillus polymyxa TaxID=1406 RepID=UPI0021E392BD|nr:FRG domain-containing protein [Paenibacillus polymyxa]
MKVYQSGIFGEIPEPETIMELMEIIASEHSEENKLNVRFWRGQSNILWPIDSGAYRKLKLSGKYSFIKDYENRIKYHEGHLLKQARFKGYGEEIGKTLSDAELLAKLQHHGAATRFVDFSKNVLVSLWFCVQTNPEKTGLLLGIHTDYIGGGSEGVFEETSYEDLVDGLSKFDHPLFVETPVVSKRIAAQHGVFLYSDYSMNPIGSLKLSPEKNRTLCIAISPKLKIIARKLLTEVFDIRAITLFPDLDGFALANSVFSAEEAYRW